MMLKLSTHSFPHRDKMQLWDRDETQAPTPTLSLPGQDGALRVGWGPSPSPTASPPGQYGARGWGGGPSPAPTTA